MSKKLDKKVPVLRFPEFSESWLIKSVSELVTENLIYKPLDGNHGNLHPTSFDYVKSGIPFVMSNDIQDGVINYSKCHYISEDLAKSLQKGFSKEGDVLLTHKGTVGEVAIVGKTPFPFIMLTPQVTYYRVNNPKLLSNLFLVSFFTSYNFQKMLKVLAAGGTRPYIGITEQGKLKISIPSVKEQEKIASFLGAVDTRLTQLRRKHELLQTYKRGVMQKLFSQQIRFKCDDGHPFPDWEKKKLGEIANIIGGGTPDTYEDKYWGGQIQWFTPTELKAKYISNSVRTITDVGLQKSSAKLLPIGTILFSSRANVGDVSIALNECATNQGFQSFVVNSKTINEFLYYWVTHNKKTFLRGASGSTFLEISKQEISKIIIDLPYIKEQEKIADFLTAIDQKIEAIAKQIELTEQFKKGLLQKMFV